MANGDWSVRWERRSLRERWVVTWRTDFVRRRAVLSLCWASCGWWMIRILVLVVIGVVGMTWQRHTACGRSQLPHIRRRCGGGELLLLLGSSDSMFDVCVAVC